jgi:hypothetical protein
LKTAQIGMREPESIPSGAIQLGTVRMDAKRRWLVKPVSA